MEDPQAVGFVLRSLDIRPRVAEEANETHDEHVWNQLVAALGRVGKPGSPAADMLLPGLEWPDGPPTRGAMEALADRGERRAIEPMLRRLEKIDYTSERAVRGDLAYLCDALGTLK